MLYSTIGTKFFNQKGTKVSEHNWIESAGEDGLPFTGTLSSIKSELGISDETTKETLYMSLYYCSPVPLETLTDEENEKGMYLGDVNTLDPDQYLEVEIRDGIADPSAFFRGKTVSAQLWDMGLRDSFTSTDPLVLMHTSLMSSTYARLSEIRQVPASLREEGDDPDFGNGF